MHPGDQRYKRPTWDVVTRALRLAGYNGIAASTLSCEWENHGFSPSKALAWIKVQVLDPDDAMEHEDGGLSPVDFAE